MVRRRSKSYGGTGEKEESRQRDKQYILSRPAMHLNLFLTDAVSRLRGNAALDL
jgi:hypothetical protein